MRADTPMSHLPWRWTCVLMAATGLANAWWYGGAILNPVNVSWLLHGDPAQHLVGLAAFLAEPWHWPPGRMVGFGGPTSVVFTDSIPWLALWLKALGWPATWQPFGLWMWACHAALAWGCALWLWRMGVGAASASVAALLLSYSPMVLMRAYGHEALMAHAVLLLALLQWQKPWSARAWVFLTGLALGIHAYWALMLGVWATAAGLNAWRSGQLVGQQPAAMLVLLRQGAVGVGVLALLAWLLGYTQGDAQLSAAGLGQYSANWLTWLDPMDWPAFLQAHGRDPAEGENWSRWLPGLGHSHPGQYEGFAWLGLGGWVLVYVAIAEKVLRKAGALQPRPAEVTPSDWRWPPPLVAACLLAIWALSPVWGVGPHEALRWPLPDGVWQALSVFRASGRLVWPLTWLLLLWAAWRVGTKNWGAVVIVAALLVQWVDMAPKRGEFARRFGGHMPAAAAPVQDPVLQAAMKTCPKLLMLGPHAVQGNAWAPVGWLAAQSGAAFHPAPTARASLSNQAAAESMSWHLLASPLQWPDRTLLVTWASAGPPDWQSRWLSPWLALAERGQGGKLHRIKGPENSYLWVPQACGVPTNLSSFGNTLTP